MNLTYKKDLELVKKISDGDKKSWNSFIITYSNYIFFNISKWCLKSCQIYSVYKNCSVQDLISRKKNLDSSSTCEEGLDLYIFIFESLKTKILKYQGKSSLKTYITACLNFIYSDFFIKKHGKINIPTSLESISDIDKKVYKVLCRSSSLDNSYEKLEKLDISREQTKKSFELILKKLKESGNEKVWQHLYSQFAENQKQEYLSILDDEGNEIQRDFPDKIFDYTNKELSEYFIDSFNKLEPKYQRLLKLKFLQNLSTKEIFIKYSNIFKFEKEQDIYYEIEKAIKDLVKNLSSKYKQNNVDLKEFKDSLYDIFKLI